MWLKIVCAAVLLYGLVSGWRNGLVREICSTAGFFAGFVVAWHFHTHYDLEWGITLLLCIAIPVVLGVAASLVSLVIDHIFLVGTMNRLLGAALGCIKYGLLMAFLVLLKDKVGEWGKLLP